MARHSPVPPRSAFIKDLPYRYLLVLLGLFFEHAATILALLLGHQPFQFGFFILDYVARDVDDNLCDITGDGVRR